MSALQLISTKPNIAGSVDKRLGILAITLSCWAPDIATAITGDLPDFGLSGLVEWQPRKFARLPAGDHAGYDVEVTVEGHLSPDDADNEFYELDGALSDDPIETHWNFDVLLSVYKGKQSSDGKATWPRTLPDENGGSGRNAMHGVESWRNPGLIYTRNWVASRLPARIIDELGTVTATLPGNPSGLNGGPALTGGRDWLCIRVRGRTRGNIWQLATSFELSGPFGWVPEMYP